MHGRALVRATSPADAVALLPGPEPDRSSGTAKNAALINLHLATGQIGKPGAGPFSLTGPAERDGRARSRRPGQPAVRRIATWPTPTHRAEVARAVGRATTCRRQPGKTAVEMFEAAADGEIKALWIACTNPAQSMPDQATVRARARARRVRRACRKPSRPPPRARYADLLLPATTWGEKDGTVTNSERRISRVRAAVPAPGEARARLAHRGRLRAPAGSAAAAGHARRCSRTTTPESVWNEHRETTRGRDLDITGLSYALLEASGPQQWPFPDGATHGRARLYDDGVFADRRRPRPLRRRRATSRWPSRAMRAIRSRSPPAACATSGTA